MRFVSDTRRAPGAAPAPPVRLRPDPPPGPAESTAGPGRTPRQALLVDRAGPLRDTALERLNVSGFEVRTADDGLYALMLALRERPDVIVIGLAVAGIDVERLFHRLRRGARTADIPVVRLGARETHTFVR